MLLQYRVSLDGIKGFLRVYHFNAGMTLYELHKFLNYELDFPGDQLIQFKSFNDAGEVVARYALFDIGYGTVDEVSLEKTVKDGITRFTYFYDVPNRKSVTLSLDGEAEPSPKSFYPELKETKGPNPIEFERGYIAPEDRASSLTESSANIFRNDFEEEDFEEEETVHEEVFDGDEE